MRRGMQLLGLLLLLSELAGCTLLHELQPHRVRRINRGPPPSLDPEFLSVNDRSKLQRHTPDVPAIGFTARAQSE